MGMNRNHERYAWVNWWPWGKGWGMGGGGAAGGGRGQRNCFSSPTWKWERRCRPVTSNKHEKT